MVGEEGESDKGDERCKVYQTEEGGNYSSLTSDERSGEIERSGKREQTRGCYGDFRITVSIQL